MLRFSTALLILASLACGQSYASDPHGLEALQKAAAKVQGCQCTAGGPCICTNGCDCVQMTATNNDQSGPLGVSYRVGYARAILTNKALVVGVNVQPPSASEWVACRAEASQLPGKQGILVCKYYDDDQFWTVAALPADAGEAEILNALVATRRAKTQATSAPTAPVYYSAPSFTGGSCAGGSCGAPTMMMGGFRGPMFGGGCAGGSCGGGR